VNVPRVVDGLPYPPRTAGEVVLTEVIADALRGFKAAGFVLIVVTNQPDVACGMLRLDDVHAVHARLGALLPIDAFYCCPHDDKDGCACRKPKPGMLLAAAQEWHIGLRASFMVGDRWRDIDAGTAAGCTTVFIDYGYHEQLRSAPHHTITSPREIAACILKTRATV